MVYGNSLCKQYGGKEFNVQPTETLLNGNMSIISPYVVYEHSKAQAHLFY